MNLFEFFCNICFCTTKSLVGISDENEKLKYILLSFIGSPEMVNKNVIYLCPLCCEELTRFDKFRETCYNNFLHFRQEYFKLKEKLELQCEADITARLKDFVVSKVLQIDKNDTCNFAFPVELEVIKDESDAVINDIVCCTVVNVGGIELTDCNEFSSVTTVTLDDNREVKMPNVIDSYIKQQDFQDEVVDEDCKLHKEIDLDNTGEEIDCAPHADTTENDEDSGSSPGIICRTQEENSKTNILTEDADSEDTGVKRRRSSHECEYCRKSFATKGTLNTHRRIHTGLGPYKCSTCGQTFTQRRNLNAHTINHTGERRYKCSTCDQTFTQKRSLDRHTRTHTGEKPYKCSRCGQTFTDKSNLDSHTRTHTGERPYKCSRCGKTFAQKNNLNTHTRTHTGEKPYKCSRCGKPFADRSSLNSHTRTHTGEKPYKCSRCGQTFAQKCNLNTHTRTHTGERPYKCSICGQSFAHKCTLDSHTRTHTGVKPYKCSRCGQTFAHKSSLDSHTRTHTEEKP